MSKKYKFYSDAGHGWLAVKREELIEQGVLHRVSHYSYQKGKTVYLEEDCDATLFIQTIEKRGVKVEYTDVYVGQRSPIRSYESFRLNTGV